MRTTTQRYSAPISESQYYTYSHSRYVTWFHTQKNMSVNKILHFAFMHDLAQMAQKVKLHGVVFTTVDLTVQDMGTAR